MPDRSRRTASRVLVGLLVASAVAGTLAVRSSHAATAQRYAIQLALVTGSDKSLPRVQVRDGEPFTVATGPWRVEMTVRAAARPGTVWVESKVYRDKHIVGTPKVLTHLQEPAGIRVEEQQGAFAMMVVVTPM